MCDHEVHVQVSCQDIANKKWQGMCIPPRRDWEVPRGRPSACTPLKLKQILNFSLGSEISMVAVTFFIIHHLITGTIIP